MNVVNQPNTIAWYTVPIGLNMFHSAIGSPPGFTEYSDRK